MCGFPTRDHDFPIFQHFLHLVLFYLVICAPPYGASLTRIATAAITLSPLDVIKTRLQFQGKYENVKHYNGFIDAFSRIGREEGIFGFFRGLPARIIYQIPAAAASFFFYEQIVHSVREKDVRFESDPLPD